MTVQNMTLSNLKKRVYILNQENILKSNFYIFIIDYCTHTYVFQFWQLASLHSIKNIKTAGPTSIFKEIYVNKYSL